MTRHQRSILAALALAVGLLPGGARAQSYGAGDQVLTIGAASFEDQESDPGDILGDGYLYHVNPQVFFASVVLPNGAEITQICLYATNHKGAPSCS